MLGEHLATLYAADHEVVVYEASWERPQRAHIIRTPLGGLALAAVTPGSTLYVPAKDRRPVRFDVAERLGFSREALDAVSTLDW